MQHHIVQYSGGIGSWAVAQIVAEQVGTENMTLLFADVLNEDPDIYRFLDDSSNHLGVPVTRICEGRTPFQLFEQSRFLGNSRLAPCSSHLKISPARARVEKDFPDPADCVIYVGIDRTEQRRCAGIANGWAPYRVEFPLCWSPYRTLVKADLLAWARTEGIQPPRLYDLGFDHNNCGGRCVRGGIKHWSLLLDRLPDRFREAEELETRMRLNLGKDISILREQRKGVVRNLTLAELRGRIEAQQPLPNAS